MNFLLILIGLSLLVALSLKNPTRGMSLNKVLCCIVTKSKFSTVLQYQSRHCEAYSDVQCEGPAFQIPLGFEECFRKAPWIMTD